MIKIEVHSTRAVIRYQEPLTVGLRGAKLRFSFGAPWEGLNKTAVFRQGDKTVTVADVGNEAIIPWEVLMMYGMPVQIGVYGFDSAGTVVIPTVWVETAAVRPGTDPEGDPSTEPTPGLWEQMQGQLGSLQQLETEEKTSLVGAVNEVKNRIPHQLSQLENDAGYLTAAPVTSVNGKTGAVNLEIPSKTSQLTNDSGYLTEAPVTSVNGQTGEVTLPGVVKVSLRKRSDGQYMTSMSREKIKEVHDAGNTVFCQYDDVILPLVSANSDECVFSCIYSGEVYRVNVLPYSLAEVSQVPLAAGSGADGITPHIGDNGNWFIGDTDTGMPSRGEAGVNPTVIAERFEGPEGSGANIWIEYPDGTLSGTCVNDGRDGTSPEVSVSEITGGHRITVADANGTKNVDVMDGSDYVLTEADKAELVRLVIESLGGNPVFGYVDANNNIIVSGKLADGTYTVKYELEDGSTLDIGALVLDNNVYYTITNTLTNCVNSNGAAQIVEGGSYTATISANSGYELSSVAVTMGGADITASAVSGGTISVAEVTGDIVITAVAVEMAVEPAYTNLADPSDANWKEGIRLNSSYAEVDGPGMVTTNFIPAVKGNKIYVKGLSFGSVAYERVVQYIDTATANNAIVSTVNTELFSTSNGITTITLDGSVVMANSTHVRICGTLTGTSDDVIITVNEEIV